MSKKVNVLLSAYNGEKYIKAQIDSILNQSYPNVELYVRDDGSKDGTLAIVREYEEKGLLHLEAGENVGFVKSFEWLIANGGEADYYAFSDQDDVWFEDKIKMAVEKLEHARENVPVLYFSNYDFYDGDLNFMAHRDGRTPNISFVNSLVDCVSLGFNSVFNRKAKDMVTEQMPEKSTGHDWWMYMVCAGMGEVIYDERPTVKYRRHNNNVSDGGDSFIKFQLAVSNGQTFQLKWNTTGNECTEWEYEDLAALAMAIGTYVQPFVARQQELEIAIKACTTMKELDEIGRASCRERV